MNDPRGLVMEEWRVPTEAYWEELITFVGGKDIARKKIKSNSFEWEDFGGDNDFGMGIMLRGFMGSRGLAQLFCIFISGLLKIGKRMKKTSLCHCFFDGLSDEIRTSFGPKSGSKYIRLI